MGDADIILDGREWNQSFTVSLKKMQEAGLLCDAEILCSDDNDVASAKPLLAHSCVLAASSPTLKNILIKQSANTETGMKPVDSMGYGEQIWHFLLEFMYKSHVVIPADQRHYLQEIEDAAMNLSLRGLIDAVTLAQTTGDEENAAAGDIVEESTAEADTAEADTAEASTAEAGTTEAGAAQQQSPAASPTKKSHRLALKRKNLGQRYSAKKRKMKFDEDDDYKPLPYMTSDEKHVCEICYGEFKTRRPLQQHIKMFHPEYKRHFCKKCCAPFNTPVALADHGRKEHNDKLLECIICYKEFYTKDAWRRHMRLYHADAGDTEQSESEATENADKVFKVEDTSSTPYLVSVTQLSQIKDVAQHGGEEDGSAETMAADTEVNVTEGGSEEGDMLGDGESAAVLEDEETATVIKIEPAGAEAADSEYKEQEEEEEEAVNVSLNEAHSDPDYSLKPAKPRGLRGPRKKARNFVMNGDKFSCTECPKEFETQNGLVGHQQRCHPNKFRGKHVCSTCSRSFGTPAQLDDHHRIKHGAEPLKCDMCDKTFITRDSIYRHERFKHHLRGRRILKKLMRYECGDCGEAFRLLRKLEDHQRLEHGAPPLICETCGMTFTSKDTLYRHNRFMHGNNGRDTVAAMALQNLTEEEKAKDQEAIEWRKKNCKNVCEICNYVALSKVMLEEHLKKHSDEKGHKCSFCDKEFKYKVGLTNHRAKHHPEASSSTYQCTACDMVFGRMVFLEDHMRKCHDAPLLQCDYCEKQHVTQDAMYRHKRYDHPDMQKKRIKVLHKCDVCDHTTLSKGAMKLHKLRHTDVRAFVCEVCGMDFKYKGDLLKHTRAQHMPDYVPPTYSCELCGHECKNKNMLDRHYVSRHKKAFTRSFPCHICNKDFGSKTNRDDHIRFDHNGEKIQCQFCKQQFSDVNSWYSHKQKEHLDFAARASLTEDLFSCGICKKEFRKIPLLRRHERYHVTERPYKCETCGTAFIAKEDLKAHLKVHTGEKPFGCPHCSFTTSRKPALTIHMRKHDESQHLHCPQCSRTYVAPISLRKHMRSAHGVKKEEEDGIIESIQAQQTIYFKIEQESCTEDTDAVTVAPASETGAAQPQVYTTYVGDFEEVSQELGAVMQEQQYPAGEELVSEHVTVLQPQQQIIHEQQAFVQEQQADYVEETEAVPVEQQQMMIEATDAGQLQFASVAAGAGAGGGEEEGEGEQVMYIMEGDAEQTGQIVHALDENGQEVMFIKLGDDQFVQMVDPDMLT